MGSQWLSDPYQIKVREMVQSGKLGQITKIEQVWNDNGPRWHDPKDPDVAALRKEDTDWNRWLLGKPDTPFDPWKYFEFRIFRDYSGGITSQWLSHAIGLVHFYTGTAIPDSMVAHGGIFAWPDIRQNPDTFQCLATYDEARLLYSYSSSYGNRFGDYTCIRGKEGTLYAQGGEGSPRWFFIPEQAREDAFDRFEGLGAMVKKGKAHLVTVPGSERELPPTHLSDDSKPHLGNWIDCMRARNPKTNGHIETGFWHSVGAIMATRAYREGKKMYWDRSKEEIVDHPLRDILGEYVSRSWLALNHESLYNVEEIERLTPSVPLSAYERRRRPVVNLAERGRNLAALVSPGRRGRVLRTSSTRSYRCVAPPGLGSGRGSCPRLPLNCFD